MTKLQIVTKCVLKLFSSNGSFVGFPFRDHKNKNFSKGHSGYNLIYFQKLIENAWHGSEETLSRPPSKPILSYMLEQNLPSVLVISGAGSRKTRR